MSNASCRLSINAATRLDTLIQASWEAADDLHADPTNTDLRAAYVAACKAVDACRAATGE